MGLHEASGRWRLGLALSVLTMVCWGALPVTLKITLQQMDALTVTTYRFLAAFIFLAVVLKARRALPNVRTFSKHTWILLFVAVCGLVSNYILYLFGLGLTSPGNAQVMIQIAPLLFTIGALVIFRERFSRWQWAGLTILFIGLALFFDDQLRHLLSNIDQYYYGCVLIFLAAIGWAAYALAQKQLLKHMGSQVVMLFIYLVGCFGFLPFSHFGQAAEMDALHLAMLVACAANAIVSYGAFAEALVHWEASRVSAVVSMAPLVTLATMKWINYQWPKFLPEQNVSALGFLGAILVVSGSASVALGGRRKSA